MMKIMHLDSCPDKAAAVLDTLGPMMKPQLANLIMHIMIIMPPIIYVYINISP